MTIAAGILGHTFKGATLKTLTFSGTVKRAGVGVVRTIRIYKKNFFDLPWETASDADGDWSMEVPGGSRDEFVVICFGEAGENSQIFDHVME